MTDHRFVCSGCGGDRTTVLVSRPSIDDRYGVGWCDDCDPPVTLAELQLRRDKQNQGRAKAQKESLPPVTALPERHVGALVRADVWKPAILTDRQASERRKLLLSRLVNGAKMSDAEADEARAIRDGYFR